MYQVTNISNAAKQRLNLVTPEGELIVMSIEYKPLQYGWFITELTYNDFVLRGVRLVTSPNVLYQFKNKLPFGLCIKNKNNFEPMLQQDFSSGNSTMFILTSDEVEQLENFLSGEITA